MLVRRPKYRPIRPSPSTVMNTDRVRAETYLDNIFFFFFILPKLLGKDLRPLRLRHFLTCSQ